MRLTEIDRRRFLALLLTTPLPLSQAVAFGRGDNRCQYLTARKSAGRYEAVMLDAFGNDLRVVALPDRGHSFAIDPVRGRAVAFGRQPGFFATTFDLDGHGPVHVTNPAPGRHFFGHGVYSADGRHLYATENDFEAGRGVLGVYAVESSGALRRVGEHATAGVGPHEVVLLPDGRTLCVANGGILTHPDYGKLGLNLDTMKPSLTYLDAATGKLLEQVFLPDSLHRLSLRHLAVDASATVWVGCQYMGSSSDQPALVACHRRGKPVRLVSAPQELWREMRNYVGSVAASASGRNIATSSPVGSCVVFWDAVNGQLLGRVSLDDGCGVAPAESEGFLLSSGAGALASIPQGRKQTAQQAASADDIMRVILPAKAGLAWDNHLRKV